MKKPVSDIDLMSDIGFWVWSDIGYACGFSLFALAAAVNSLRKPA